MIWAEKLRKANTTAREMLIIDNYFDDPSHIRDYAITNIKYNSPDEFQWWRGYRSEKLSIENTIENEVITKIHSTLEKKVNRLIENSDIYFHLSPEKIMVEEPDFHKTKWHTDPSDYAGVIYLTPNPPNNTGTCLDDHGCIENVYNRLLAYSSDTLHGPDHLFGDDICDVRMTITFFVWFK